VSGFSEAYALDNDYRTAHHGAELMVPAFGKMRAHTIAGPADGAGPTVVLQEDGLTITAFAVDHAPIRPA
jgi:ribonuclease Z